MKLRFFAFFPLLPWLALGCGPLVTVEVGPPGDTIEDPPGDTIEEEEENTAEAPSAFSCDFSAPNPPDRAVLAWQRGWDLMLTHADGSTTVGFTFTLAQQEPEATPWVQLAARDGFAAATANIYAKDGATISEGVLLSAKGEVVWNGTWNDGMLLAPVLGDGGMLAMPRMPTNGGLSSTMVVHPSGKTSVVDGIWPIGGPDEKGGFAALLTPDYYVQEFGWYDPQSGTKPLVYGGWYGSYPSVTDDGLFYIGVTDPEATNFVLVAETSDEIATFDVEAESPSVSTASPSGWAVVHTGWAWDAPQLVAHPKSATLAEVAVPGDRYAFGVAYYNGLGIDDTGGALFIGRDAAVGALYRSADLGKTWQTIGKTVAQVTDIQVWTRGGTYVVRPTDEPGYFPMDEWQSPAPGQTPPEQLGPSVDIVQPSTGVTRTLDPKAIGFALSHDGACVSYVENEQFRAMHVASGKVIDLDKVDVAVNAWPQGVWIP